MRNPARESGPPRDRHAAAAALEVVAIVILFIGSGFLFALWLMGDDYVDIDQPTTLQRAFGEMAIAALQDPWLWYGLCGTLIAVAVVVLLLLSERLQPPLRRRPFE